MLAHRCDPCFSAVHILWLCRVSNSLGSDCGVVTPDGCGRRALVSQSQARAGLMDQWEPGLSTGCGDLTWGYPGCPHGHRGRVSTVMIANTPWYWHRRVLTILHTHIYLHEEVTQVPLFTLSPKMWCCVKFSICAMELHMNHDISMATSYLFICWWCNV